MSRTLSAAALAVCVAALCWPAGSAGAIRWHRCAQGHPTNVQCGELSVPLDYAKPEGAKIRLGFNRLRAAARSHRIGSLILNPGGPGGAGSEGGEAEAAGPGGGARGAVRREGARLPLWDAELHLRFYLIGMAPRGIGTSPPIRCDP